MNLKTQQYIERMKSSFNRDDYDFSLIDDIKNLKTKVPVKCKKHNNLFYARASHLVNGRCGCRYCKNEKLSQIKSISNEDFVEKINNLFDNSITPLEYYKTNDDKMKFKCNNCGTIFYRRPRDLYQSRGCPSCTKYNSKLELHLIHLFNEKDIEYKYQYSFDWLGRKNVDFYLPKYKIAIECQGKQHFVTKKFFGGAQGLENTIKRDKEKKELCNMNGIKLLYYANYIFDFPYKVITNDEDLIKEIYD